MFKRILAALLVVGAVVSFTACKDNTVKTPSNQGDTPPVSGTETPGVSGETEIDYESDLSTERYDGYNYRIFNRAGEAKLQWFEEPQEDLVDDAIYRRNKAVEEKYGITITASEASGDHQTDALNSILAGDDAYDIIFAHSRSAFVYAIQGAAYNLHDIETLHLDKPWWSQNLVESCTINDRLYVLDGDISIRGLGCSMCLVFNKRIFDELGFEYPYETVKDGEWTFDEFSYLVKKGGADLNGDGVIAPADDQYGFVCDEWGAPINVLYAGGQKVYDKNDEGELELSLYSNKTVQVFDEFFGLLDSEACLTLFINGSTAPLDAAKVFSAGRAMIADTLLLHAESFRNMDDDFGIIPYPKFDEEDEYSTAINGTAPLGLIPITVSDVNRTGAITEALCAYGSRDVLPAFYEKSLKGKYARDEESEDMMDIIKASLVYDIGYVGGGTFQSVGHDLAATNHDFSSFYAAREGTALDALENFNRDYGGIGE